MSFQTSMDFFLLQNPKEDIFTNLLIFFFFFFQNIFVFLQNKEM